MFRAKKGRSRKPFFMRVEKTDKPHGSVRYCGTYVCMYTHIYMYTRSVTLRRACVVKKSVRVGCGKKGFEPSFFSKKKVGKFGRKRLRIFHAFFHRLIVPIFYGRRGKRRVSKPCCPRRVAVNSQYPMI